MFLYDGEEIVKARTYHTKNERKELLEGWKHEVGNNLNRMAIQIAPNARPDLVKISGINSRKGLPIVHRDAIKVPFTRPKAEYNNIPAYKYE